jgi:hypothetical protein
MRQNRQSSLIGANATFHGVDNGGAVEHMLAELAHWMADERATESARARMRERWLLQQATEDARLSGVAVDLAERGAAVAVRTSGGRSVRGVIAAVARDFWVVDGDGIPTLVAAGDITSVRVLPGGHVRPGVATGDRGGVLDMRLLDALAALVGQRPRVRLAVRGESEVVAGELVAVGADVLTVQLDGGGRDVLYVALSGVIECSILGSG